MHTVSLDTILAIIMNIWGYMLTHGIILSLLGTTFVLTYAVMAVGVVCITLMIQLITIIFWGR